MPPPTRLRSKTRRWPLRPEIRSGLRHDRADFRYELVEVERLGDHFHVRSEKAFGQKAAFNIAGHEQDLEMRPLLARRIGQLATVQARQADIGEEQGYGLLRLQDAQPLRPVRGVEDAVSQFL